MIFRHSLISILNDFGKFSNITKTRQKHFDSASPDFHYTQGGVEELGRSLHPEAQEFTVDAKNISSDGTFSLVLRSVTGKAALFRGGQYINVLCGENLYPFFLSSPPLEALTGTYKIFVSPGMSKEGYDCLNTLNTGDKVITSAPVGYFYRRPLRDEGVLAVITDITGRGAGLAIQSEGAAKGEEILLYSDASAEMNTEADSFFLIGKKAFCEEKRALLPPEKTHVLVTDVPEREGVTDTFTCRVLIGDRETEIPCAGNEPLITALEKSGIKTYKKCITGDCSFCRARLIEGSVTNVFATEDDSRRKSDVQFGYIHPCCAFPDSDITLKY